MEHAMKTISLSFKAAGVALLIGLLGAPGCSEEQVNAVLAGVQAASRELEGDDDISFSDWIRSELDD